jgi:hypothetical protein
VSGSVSNANRQAPVVQAAIGLGLGIHFANRALSVGRLVAATPIAAREGKLPLWAFELAMQKSTIDIVPPTGGKWNLWGKAFATSQALKGAGALLTLGIAGPAMYDAWHNHGGAEGLVGSRSGRTGVVTSIAGLMTLNFMRGAAMEAAGKGAGAMARSAFTSHTLGTWKVVAPAMVAYSIVVANQMGYLDALNSGDAPGWGEAMHTGNQSVAHTLGRIAHPSRWLHDG